MEDYDNRKTFVNERNFDCLCGFELLLLTDISCPQCGRRLRQMEDEPDKIEN